MLFCGVGPSRDFLCGFGCAGDGKTLVKRSAKVKVEDESESAGEVETLVKRIAKVKVEARRWNRSMLDRSRFLFTGNL